MKKRQEDFNDLYSNIYCLDKGTENNSVPLFCFINLWNCINTQKIWFNKNNYKNFIDAISQTNQVNKLKSCLKETTTKDPEKVFSDLKKDIDNLENLSGTIWATKFGHKLEVIDFNLNVKDKANKKSTLNGNFEFNTETKPINIPKDTINTQEFLKELQNAVFKGLYAKNG